MIKPVAYTMIILLHVDYYFIPRLNDCTCCCPVASLEPIQPCYSAHNQYFKASSSAMFNCNLFPICTYTETTSSKCISIEGGERDTKKNITIHL